MKVQLSLIAILAVAGCKSDSQTSAPAENAAAPAAAPAAPAANNEWAQPVHRGAAFTAAEEVALTDVLGAPEKFSGRTFKTSGTVARACSKKGCWMELQPQGAERGVRVTFKDYGFFVPLDSQGATATVEGTVEVKKLSAEDAEHLAAEGAKIEKNAAGEAIEVAMVATAVELKKPQ